MLKRFSQVVLSAACLAVIGAAALAQAEDQLSFNVVAVSALDTMEGHMIILSGQGTFDPQSLAVDGGGGIFVHFDNSVEEVPKPIVGEGTWRVVSVEKWTPQGETYAQVTPGVLDMVVAMTPVGDEAFQANLRVICNVGPGGMVNMENEQVLPEGFILTVAEVGTFNPVVSQEPGVPPLGLTWIGPSPGVELAGGM